MANSRIAKFIIDVAPPQYISVIRHRASKMLDTINEEERDASPNNSLAPSHRTPTSASTSAVAAASAAANFKYFPKRLREQRGIGFGFH